MHTRVPPTGATGLAIYTYKTYIGGANEMSYIEKITLVYSGLVHPG